MTNLAKLEPVGDSQPEAKEPSASEHSVEASAVPETAAVASASAPSGAGAGGGRWLSRERANALAQSVILPAITFLIVLGIWVFVHNEVSHAIPSPSATWHRAVEMLSHPFYSNGPNDMGVGWQVLYSLGRVSAGFGLAVLVGIPVGFIMGMSPTFQRAWQPLIQILRPVSPLAWLPIGLLLFRAVDPSAIFVIFITCIWPTLLNTAAGVKAIPQD